MSDVDTLLRIIRLAHAAGEDTSIRDNNNKLTEGSIRAAFAKVSKYASTDDERAYINRYVDGYVDGLRLAGKLKA